MGPSVGRTVRVAWRLVLFVLAGVLVGDPAFATLTASERAQIKGYLNGGQIENAPRVRALVARPDLSEDEASAALGEAMAPIVFTDQRAAFFREMFLGGGSVATRPIMAVAETRALIARADSLLGKFSADLDQHADTMEELARIYGFIGGEIALAGHPQNGGDGHDPAVGVPNAAYEECARRLGEHVQNNPRWLRADAPLSTEAVQVRAPLELALYDMMSISTATQRVDTADRLGLVGARRELLTGWGVLLLDTGRADDARVNRVRALPGLVHGEVIAFGASGPLVAALHARGEVIGVGVPLEATLAPRGPAGAAEEVEPGPLDLPLFDLAYELSNLTVRNALAGHGALRVLAEQDTHEHPGTVQAGMTMEQRLATVVAQLTTDAPRTLDFAFARFLRGRPSAAALVSDALGVLATASRASPALVLPLARPKAPSGELERLPATNVQLLPSGAVVAFTLDGQKWELQRDSGGTVIAVRRNGAPLVLGALPTALAPVTDGNAWRDRESGIVFARLHGSPRAGLGPGGRVRLFSGDASAVDLIATPAPGDDLVVETNLAVRGEGGVVVRAASTKDAFEGASVVVVPGASPKAILRVAAGQGREVDVGSPVSLVREPAYHVRIEVRANKLEATVGSEKLSTTLPDSLAHGDVALRVNRGGALQANAFRVGRP